MTAVEEATDVSLWDDVGEGCDLRDAGPHDGPLVNVTVRCSRGRDKTVPACTVCRDWVARQPDGKELLISGACCGGVTHLALSVTEASGLVLYTWRRG